MASECMHGISRNLSVTINSSSRKDLDFPIALEIPNIVYNSDILILLLLIWFVIAATIKYV